MSQAAIQCPHCRVVHPVAALPPTGTWLRCNHCGNAFEAGTPGGGQPAQQFPATHSYAQMPQPSAGYDPLAGAFGPGNSLPGRTLPPAQSRRDDGWETWEVAAAIGGGFALLMVVVILISSAVNARWNSTPVADNPAAASPTPATPAVPIVATPAATGASAPALPTIAPPTTTPTPVSSSPPLATASVPSVGTAEPADVVSITQLKVVQHNPPYQYKWKAGQKYRYGFEVKNEATEITGPGGKVGVVEYQVGSLTNAGSDGKDEPQKASGTAFVIHQAGLLLTCHHVVAGAASLKVHLDGKVYPADVVAIDEPNDLAVIRIKATGLPALPLGDSEAVQLAEDVKAVGYPLSDVLGRSVKITSGTLAGKINEGGKKLLQVDIAINPGNSGGPLVNTRGEVVGVNSAGLFGSRIQEVAFAVPSNLGKDLLGKINVTPSASTGGSTLNGVELAKKVTPSTAFVEVELGSESAALLEFTGRSKSTGSVTDPPQQISSRVVAGINGEVLGAQDDLTLGSGLGTFGTMVFEKLPGEGEKSWEERNVTPVSIGGGGGPRGRQVISLVIEEHVKYEIQSMDDNQIVLSKQVQIGTVGQSSTATFRITGKGTWTFDRREGVPSEMEMSMDSYINVNGQSETTKGTIRYRRLTSENPTSWQENLEKDLASAPLATPDIDSGLPKLPELRPLHLEEMEDTEVASVIRSLKGKKKSPSDYLPLLQQLSRIKPLERRRAEVALALQRIRNDLPSFALNSWIHAVKVWGTEKNLPSLISIADSSASSTADRAAAIEAIGRLPPTRESAELLVRLAAVPGLDGNAIESLSGMGKVAEEPVAGLLKETRTELRILGAVILAKVGSGKSVPVMEDYLRGEYDEKCRLVGEVVLRSLRQKAARERKKANDQDTETEEKSASKD